MRKHTAGMLLLYMFATTSVLAVPTIKFEKEMFDFGTILNGQKVNAVFPFKNTGDAVLEITEVHAGCGCTVAKATKMKVQPGESAAIKVVFDSKGQVGRHTKKSIFVTSNDQAQPTVRLHITGGITTVVDLSPPILDLGDLKVGTTSEGTLTITPKAPQSFKIVKIESSSKQVTVPRFDKSLTKDGVFSVTVRVVAGSSPGRLFEHLDIATDLPGVPPISYLIYGNIVTEAPASDKASP